ncbi:winged helix-turn-helix transcriptional regulator [Nonomuraea roseoviolacea]|uniref:DNA-binding HxlR family transcriptional regulator n=1 Tax=Nonomuraea roseoviolacea subsp. carminata TaxID=160689 RepID=A0ABT1K1Z7_9ACTN|nr:helix-turn-helix domain-containing protein [Nonomuraea roseoviolacea]MCP2347890.1 DNA-binding HxlR family transcriptional regulator [Nonomuraea roseoviolacea subsp. carminata]
MDVHAAAPPEAATCPIELAIHIIGGKWRMLVLRSLLLGGAQRYNGLLASVAGISPKELTRNLRGLEDAGLIVREPVRRGECEIDVYAVTELGSALRPALSSLGSFGVRLIQDFAAREGRERR